MKINNRIPVITLGAIILVVAIGVLAYTIGVLIYLQFKPEVNYVPSKKQDTNLQKPIIKTVVIDTNIDTTGWNIYHNEKYGYNLKYSNQWVMEEVMDRQDPIFSLEISNKWIAYFRINMVKEYEDYISTKEFLLHQVNQVNSRSKSSRYYIYIINNMELLDRQSYSQSDNSNFFGRNDVLWVVTNLDFIKENRLFHIDYVVYDGDGIIRTEEEAREAGEEFKNILKTIKFD